MLDRNGCTHFEAALTIAAMPARIASAIVRTEAGLAVWSLRFLGADVPGRWVVTIPFPGLGKTFHGSFAVLGVPIAMEQKTTIFLGGRSGERSFRRARGRCKASFMDHTLRVR